jgi:Phage integrase family
MLAKCGERADLSLRPHPHMRRHACGYKLANDGHDTRAIQTYFGHRSITSTTIYTETNAGRFMGFWGKPFSIPQKIMQMTMSSLEKFFSIQQKKLMLESNVEKQAFSLSYAHVRLTTILSCKIVVGTNPCTERQPVATSCLAQSGKATT